MAAAARRRRRRAVMLTSGHHPELGADLRFLREYTRPTYIYVTFRPVWSHCVPASPVPVQPWLWTTRGHHRLTCRSGCHGPSRTRVRSQQVGVGLVEGRPVVRLPVDTSAMTLVAMGATRAGGGLRHPPAQGRRQRAADIHRADGGDVPGPRRGPGRQGRRRAGRDDCQGADAVNFPGRSRVEA